MAWLGFVGLLLDFFGVVILTLDILPEFRLHRREQRLRQLRMNTAHLMDGDPAGIPEEESPVMATTIGALAMVRASNASLYDHLKFDALTARSALNTCAYDFQAKDDEKVMAALKGLTFSRSAFDEALDVLDAKAANAHGNLARRRRPNLFWGVFFVLVGFAIQAFAAMPMYAQIYALNALLRFLGAPP